MREGWGLTVFMFDDLHRAKVSDLNVHVFSKQDVLWLQVPAHDSHVTIIKEARTNAAVLYRLYMYHNIHRCTRTYIIHMYTFHSQ